MRWNVNGWLLLCVPMVCPAAWICRTSIGIGLRHLADEEEGRLDAFGGEQVENAAGVGGQRAVVEGEHDLLVGERQRLGILHHPETDMFVRVDDQSAARPERVRLSRAFGRVRRACRDQREQAGGCAQGAKVDQGPPPIRYRLVLS